MQDVCPHPRALSSRIYHPLPHVRVRGICICMCIIRSARMCSSKSSMTATPYCLGVWVCVCNYTGRLIGREVAEKREEPVSQSVKSVTQWARGKGGKGGHELSWEMARMPPALPGFRRCAARGEPKVHHPPRSFVCAPALMMCCDSRSNHRAAAAFFMDLSSRKDAMQCDTIRCDDALRCRA